MRTILLSLLAMSCGLNAATVNIALTNFTAQSFASNTVLQLFYTNQPALNGNWVQAGVPVRIAAPYGVVSTNLLAGAYQLTVVGQYWSSPLNFNVPNDTNTYSLTQLATNATVVTANAPHVLSILSGDTDAATVSSNAGVYTITVIGGGGGGITLLQATNAAQGVVELSNAVVRAEIYTASNAAYAAAVTNYAQFTNAGTLDTNAFTRLSGLAERGQVLRTPILGVDPWFFGPGTGSKSATTNLLTQIDALLTNGLAAHGWRWVQIPDTWQGGRTNGILYPHSLLDITNVCRYANSNGIGLIIYTEPTTNTSNSAWGTPPEYIEQDIAQFVDWGVRGVRLDFPGMGMDERLYYLRRFRAAIDKYAKPDAPVILYSSGWQMFFRYNTNTTAMAEAMSVADVLDVTLDNGMMGPTVFTDYLARWRRQQSASYLTRPGHWLVPQASGGAVNATYSSFWGLYALLSSGSMVAAISPGASINMLKNTDLTLLRNDPLFAPAITVRSNATEQVIFKQLGNGDIALGLINLDTNATTTVTINFTNMGWVGRTFTVRDVVNQATWSNATEVISVPIVKDTAVTLRLTPVATDSTLLGKLTTSNVTATASMTLGGETRTNWPTGGATSGITNGQDNVRLGGIGLTNGYISIAPGVTINSEDNASFTMSHALTVNGNVVADAFDGGSGVLTNLVSDYASVGGIGFTNSVITIGTNTINDEAGELRIESPSLTVAGSVNATAFDGSGAALTNLNASALASGAVPAERIPAVIPALSSLRVTNSVNGSDVLVTNGGWSVSTYTWAGPTNTINAEMRHRSYQSAGNWAVTGMVGAVSGRLFEPLLSVSNSSGGAITGWISAGLPLATSTNALVIPAGKWGHVSWAVMGGGFTNFATGVSQ